MIGRGVEAWFFSIAAAFRPQNSTKADQLIPSDFSYWLQIRYLHQWDDNKAITGFMRNVDNY